MSEHDYVHLDRKYVVWIDYGMEGWRPYSSSDDIAELAAETMKFPPSSGFVVTEMLDVRFARRGES